MQPNSHTKPTLPCEVVCWPKTAEVVRRDLFQSTSGLMMTAIAKSARKASVIAGFSTLAASGLSSAASAEPSDQKAEIFSGQTVHRIAEALSRKPFKNPAFQLPDALAKLTYDQYRDIRYLKDKAIWRGEGLGYELQYFSVGFLYDVPVDIALVEDGRARALKATPDLFTFGPLVGNVPEDAKLGFSGFRIHGSLNGKTYLDEYAVFQGASYFRLVARGQVYGLSARGLAINTARPEGEEFPFFRSFWIEKPKTGAGQIVVHALLDSKSVTGAYTFAIAPGMPAVIDVKATLYPRRDLPHVGIAPLTSMYLLGPAQDRLPQDFRPSVHDSEGLAIVNAAGEHIWRPLTNPKTLQVSAFVDNGPKRFGLAQRDRSFTNFEDLEARYEKRPTAWIEPKGDWGAGFVELVEIPTQEEIHDNIVAYWMPAKGLTAGKPHSIAYRLNWGRDIPASSEPLAKVLKTRLGVGPRQGTYRVVVDFSGEGLIADFPLPTPYLTAMGVETSNLVIRPNPETNGWRVSFDLNPGEKNLAELRLSLSNNEKTISEVWLYRWTRS